VPLIITLYKLAVPLNEDVPVKVAVPAEARKLPITLREDPIEKLVFVLIEPETDKTLNAIVPVPEIVFDIPLMVMVPPDKDPLTDKLPVIFIELEVVTEPLTVKLDIEMPGPVIVLVLPLIVSVPPAE
jgi:hypothetical protein